MITLNNDHITVRVDESHGGTIRQVGARSTDNILADYDWEAPGRASTSLSYGSSQLDWLSEYRGGWQELFPNAGPECELDGVPLPFHGEVSSSRWQVTARTETSVSMRVPARLPLVLERRMELDADAAILKLEETVTNESDRPVSFLWGHHPAFVFPAGSSVELPRGLEFEVAEGIDSSLQGVAEGSVGSWPHAVDDAGEEVDLSLVPPGPVSRLCYVRGGAAWSAIRPPQGLGVAMSWDSETFPVLWIWHEIGTPGFPWFGRSNITAIEPATSYPADGLTEASERGEAHVIEGGGEHSTWLTLRLFDAQEGSVADVHRDGSIEFRNQQGEERE